MDNLIKISFKINKDTIRIRNLKTTIKWDIINLIEINNSNNLLNKNIFKINNNSNSIIFKIKKCNNKDF